MDKIKEKVSSLSLYFKAIGVFFLLMMLLIPKSMVMDVLQERQNRQTEANENISNIWGADQHVIAPTLSYKFKEEFIDVVDKKTTKRYESFWVQTQPESLSVDLKVLNETRKRGIFSVPVYTSKGIIQGSFKVPEIPDQNRRNIIGDKKYHKVELFIPLYSSKSLSLLKLKVFDKTIDTFKVEEIDCSNEDSTRSCTEIAVFEGGILDQLKSGELVNFSIEFEHRGSRSLSTYATAATNKIHMESNWPSPSFKGDFLPFQHTISSKGFVSDWNVNLFAQSGKQALVLSERALPKTVGTETAVEFINPVNHYSLNERATKYGILFLGLTFLAFFLLELSSKRRVHVFQYSLVGLALILFYLLLLALSEHISFLMAYTIAALVCIGLISLYTKAIVKVKGIALKTSTSLGLLYSFLYVLLNLEDYALLAGALLITGILGLVMYFTRSIDWYNQTKVVENNESSSALS